MYWLPALLLFGLAASMIVGAILLRSSSRIVSTRPSCARCKYDLSAFTSHGAVGSDAVERTERNVPGSFVCPECGSELTDLRSVRYRATVTRWRYLVSGLLLLAIPLFFFLRVTIKGDPAFLLHNHREASLLQLAEEDEAEPFVTELFRRIRAAELSPEALNGLSRRTLDRARSREPMSLLGGYTENLLGTLVDAGAITPAELAQLIGQPHIVARVPSRSRRNEDQEIEFRVTLDVPNLPDGLCVVAENVTVRFIDLIDDRPVSLSPTVVFTDKSSGRIQGAYDHSYGTATVLVRSSQGEMENGIGSRSREFHILADLVVRRKDVEIVRVSRFEVEGTQRVVDDNGDMPNR